MGLEFGLCTSLRPDVSAPLSLMRARQWVLWSVAEAENDLARRSSALGERFRDRLPGAEIDDALQYVEFGECVLALEVLASRLFDASAELTVAERQEFDDLLSAFPDGDASRLRYLDTLVGRTSS